MSDTLDECEHHPAADSAMDWIRQFSMSDLHMWLNAFSSCAIEGNRLAEICSGTLNRLIDGKPVSDRYLLGLCWTMRGMKEGKGV